MTTLQPVGRRVSVWYRSGVVRAWNEKSRGAPRAVAQGAAGRPIIARAHLRPGVGDHFIATGYALRTGNKVAVTRMELHNNERQLIAVGTGAYVVA